MRVEGRRARAGMPFLTNFVRSEPSPLGPAPRPLPAIGRGHGLTQTVARHHGSKARTGQGVAAGLPPPVPLPRRRTPCPRRERPAHLTHRARRGRPRKFVGQVFRHRPRPSPPRLLPAPPPPPPPGRCRPSGADARPTRPSSRRPPG